MRKRGTAQVERLVGFSIPALRCPLRGPLDLVLAAERKQEDARPVHPPPHAYRAGSAASDGDSRDRRASSPSWQAAHPLLGYPSWFWLPALPMGDPECAEESVRAAGGVGRLGTGAGSCSGEHVGVHVLGFCTFYLERLHAAAPEQRTSLARYAAAIQRQRGDYNGRVLSLRAEDLRALSTMYGVSPGEVAEQLLDSGVLARDRAPRQGATQP